MTANIYKCKQCGKEFDNVNVDDYKVLLNVAYIQLYDRCQDCELKEILSEFDYYKNNVKTIQLDT